MSFSNVYPMPEEFHQILGDTKTNDEANRALQQIALQSQIGQKLLVVVVQQLQQGKCEILKLVPIPKTICTEDGWEFHLDIAQQLYETADGSNIGLLEVLHLLSLRGEERNAELFPNFQVLEWTNIC